MSTVLRINFICRVCLKEENDMLVLFDKYANENPADSLRAAVNLEYLPHDELPNQICRECFNKTHECLAFQTQCAQSEKLFQHFLEQKERQSQSNFYLPETIAQQITYEELASELNYPTIEIDNDEPELVTVKEEIYMPDSSTEIQENNDKNYSNSNVKCHICRYTFVSAARLTTHLKIHSGIDHDPVLKPGSPIDTNEPPYRKRKKQINFVCRKCGIRSLTYGQHRRHLESHKGPPSRHTCSICNKTYINRTNLVCHIRIHTNERRYKCSVCEQRFVHWSSWKSHELIHSDRLNHICEVCGKSYKRKTELRTHFESTHTDKKYSCEICGKEYRKRCLWSVHMNTHTNAKLYVCKVCGKTFNRKNSRNTHQKIHTGNRCHVCYVCGKGFVFRHVLQGHLRTHNIFIVKNTDTPDVKDMVNI